MAQEESTSVWNGPPLLLGIVDSYQPTISLETLMQGKLIRFHRDLITSSDEGAFSIPILIAGPMLILRYKHEEEVESGGAEKSFLNELERPAKLKPAGQMSIGRIYDQLSGAASLENFWNVLGQLPTRVVFEFLVNVIQRLKPKVKMDVRTAMNMSTIDLASPGFLNPGAAKSIRIRTDFLKAMKLETATENQFKMRLCNAISYMWAKDLTRNNVPENQMLIFRFIMVNFIHIIRTFFKAEAKNTAIANDRFLIINFNSIHNARTNPLIQVMGVKLGRFLINIPEDVFQLCYKDEPASVYYRTALPVFTFSNLLLMNTPETFYPSPKREEFIHHDKTGCNFDNPQCVCQSINQLT
ncbi:hypothetical protein Aperf_G00000124294 [Anoplocephala perfoliata]